MRKILFFLGLTFLLSFSLISADTIPKEWDFYINNRTIKFNFNEDYNFTGIIYVNPNNLNINNNYIFNITTEENQCNITLITLTSNSVKWNITCPSTTDWVYHKIGNFSSVRILYIDDISTVSLTPSWDFISYNYTGSFSTQTHEFELNNHSVAVLSNPRPLLDEQFDSTTTAVTIGVTTDVIAECRYSTNPGTNYANMTNFTNTNSTTHSSLISVSFGNTYNYYVKCNTTEGARNPTDYRLYFAVKASDPGGGSGSGGDIPDDVDIICGDGICQYEENATNCPEDCISYANTTVIYPTPPSIPEQFYCYLFSEISETPSGFIVYRWMPVLVILIVLGIITYYLSKRKERIIEKVNKYLKKKYYFS